MYKNQIQKIFSKSNLTPMHGNLLKTIGTLAHLLISTLKFFVSLHAYFIHWRRNERFVRQISGYPSEMAGDW